MERKNMKLMKAAEVAAILRVSPARIYEIARRGLLPTVRIGERQVRFAEEAVREWIANGGAQVTQSELKGN